MWVNTGEIPGNGIDDDGNGFVDDVHGYDFVNNDGDPYDDFGHGTHVAGTIAAVGNNGIGVTGVTWNARIMAVKFLDASGNGTLANAIKAVLYAASMGARVMNNSWAGGGFSQALLDAIRAADEAGALFVAAAGNASSDNDAVPNFPSNYDVPNVVAVAATDQNDLKAFFSNFGAKSVHLGAPGVSILSTEPTIGNVCCSNATGYGFLDGTSMATPHVSGAAALLLSRFPGIDNHHVRDRLLANTDPIAALSTSTVTGGRLNVANAMEVDEVPPAAVTDLASTDVRARAVSLSWSATGDDGLVGTAWRYDLRYSPNPIDDGNFSQAKAAISFLKASSPGTPESFVVKGLDPSTNYYFALRVHDNVGNESPLSNVVTVQTRAVTVAFQDDMESGPSKWTIEGTDGGTGSALWHLSTHRAASPVTAFYYGREDTLTYNTGTRNFGSITSVPIDLTGHTDSLLSFTHFLQTESTSPFDTARVQVSNNNGATWTDVYVNAISTDMVRQDLSLAAYDGNVILLRFSFDTLDQAFNQFEGWVVDDVTVTASASNRPPTANAGGPYSGAKNQAIAFSGTASSDPDGDPLTYAWSFGDGSTGSGPTPTHAYAATGTYTVSLVVNDGSTDSPPATTTVTVGNQPPVANAGGPYSGYRNQAITFTGSGTDADGDALTFTWDFGDGSTASGATATHAYAALGTYTVTLIANDGETNSSPASAIVTIQNQLPLANAGADQTVRRVTQVLLNGAASADVDGTVVGYQWQQAAGPTVTLNQANSAVANFLAPDLRGRHTNPLQLTFSLTVTDNDGGQSVDQVVITVTR
jgi:PKD repeat protein